MQTKDSARHQKLFTPKLSNMNFENVLITDGVAWTLFGMAQQEGLLYTKDGEGFTGRPPSRRDRQAALSLLVLFDKLLVHDHSPGPGTFRLPDLERDGVLEIVAASEPSAKVAPLRSSWKPSNSDPRKTPPLSLRRDLALVQTYKPLIVDRLMSVRSEFETYMARTLGISRRTYNNEFLDLATNYALGNRALLRNNLIERALPRKLLDEMKSELFDFQKRGELLSETNARLVAALVFAEEIAVIKELSATRGLGVASRHYTRGTGTDEGFTVDPSQVPRSFGLIRSILHEEGHFFPEIESIGHALRLRKNPHLRAFKEQFREFHTQLASGDSEALERVRKEVGRAKRALERTAKWSLALRWLTYISLPTSLAESLLVGAPIVGTSLAVMSAAGTIGVQRASRQNEWVLFGV